MFRQRIRSFRIEDILASEDSSSDDARSQQNSSTSTHSSTGSVDAQLFGNAAVHFSSTICTISDETYTPSVAVGAIDSLSCVLQVFQTRLIPGHTSTNPRQHSPIRVCALFENVPSKVGHEKTYAHAYR
jgi:hypothetical protein